jgi:hypothetical protein
MFSFYARWIIRAAREPLRWPCDTVVDPIRSIVPDRAIHNGPLRRDVMTGPRRRDRRRA